MRNRVVTFVGTAAGLSRYLTGLVPSDESRCPACGEWMSFCQGHGEIGDPRGWGIMNMHDEGWHGLCHPTGCSSATSGR